MATIFEQVTEFLAGRPVNVGIDLGTANTLVYLSDKGVVLNEPSLVITNKKTGRVVAIGTHAKEMIGRTPPHVEEVQPIVEGVISHYEAAEEMLRYLVSRSLGSSRLSRSSQVVVCVPSGITNVEVRAVRNATRQAGARHVHIVEEPVAAAIGNRLPVLDPVGTMVVDIGGGTTDIAIISLGGIVAFKNLKVAGDHFDEAIINYIRDEFKVLVGKNTAERLKKDITMLIPQEELLELQVKGKDLVTGLPREITVTEADMREALAPLLRTLIRAIKDVIEASPPEVAADVLQRGIYLTGGGALIQGLREIIESATSIPTYVVDDPLTSVARGAGIVADEIQKFIDITLPEHAIQRQQ